MDMNGMKTVVDNIKEDVLRDLKELRDELSDFKDEFHAFKREEFIPLRNKVDKISTRVAWILGGFSALNITIWVIFKILDI